MKTNKAGDQTVLCCLLIINSMKASKHNSKYITAKYFNPCNAEYFMNHTPLQYLYCYHAAFYMRRSRGGGGGGGGGGGTGGLDLP